MSLTAGPARAPRPARVEAPWTLWGFLGPVDIGALNVAPAGATVPFHFRVFAGDVELTDPAVVWSFAARRVIPAPPRSPFDTGPTEAVEVPTTTGATMLRYTDGRFEQTWRTPPTPGRYVVTVATVDGGRLSADVLLR